MGVSARTYSDPTDTGEEGWGFAAPRPRPRAAAPRTPAGLRFVASLTPMLAEAAAAFDSVRNTV